jgi:hypothetical protein
MPGASLATLQVSPAGGQAEKQALMPVPRPQTNWPLRIIPSGRLSPLWTGPWRSCLLPSIRCTLRWAVPPSPQNICLYSQRRRGIGPVGVNVHTDDGVDPPDTRPGDFSGGEIRGQIEAAN